MYLHANGKDLTLCQEISKLVHLMSLSEEEIEKQTRALCSQYYLNFEMGNHISEKAREQARGMNIKHPYMIKEAPETDDEVRGYDLPTTGLAHDTIPPALDNPHANECPTSQ